MSQYRKAYLTLTPINTKITISINSINLTLKHIIVYKDYYLFLEHPIRERSDYSRSQFYN
ncbi:hypothetical protein GCM10022395_02120 [Snuella lapsa]|uniref:Uncharacterized protein n=1 Tax=Snuella lapsa TaxID=870481 RepID=A0ABP6WR10_9FLAO